MSPTASTILAQLGGNQFLKLTGTKTMVFSDDSLKVIVAGGIHVKITLDPSDTYTVHKFKLRGADMVAEKIVSDVYCDSLKDVFESLTGLYVTLYARR